MKRFGFPKSNRVTKNTEYRVIYQSGDKVVDSCLVVYFRPNQLNRVRLGISVSKKLGGAVVRNRLKRLFREVFRQNKHRYRPGYDLVWIARKPMLELNFDQLNKRLDKVLARAGLLNPGTAPEEEQTK
jgi:ribonuclease P protein component